MCMRINQLHKFYADVYAHLDNTYVILIAYQIYLLIYVKAGFSVQIIYAGFKLTLIYFDQPSFIVQYLHTTNAYKHFYRNITIVYSTVNSMCSLYYCSYAVSAITRLPPSYVHTFQYKYGSRYSYFYITITQSYIFRTQISIRHLPLTVIRSNITLKHSGAIKQVIMNYNLQSLKIPKRKANKIIYLRVGNYESEAIK